MEITAFEDIPKDMILRLNAAKEMVLSENSTLRIISHYDADGICAAAIICQALSRESRKFHVTLTSNLSSDYVDLMAREEYPITIFCDMGSGQLESLSKLKGRVIILDHHIPQGDSEELVHVNSNLFDIAGTDEICASSLAFLFSIVISQNNWDLACVAVAGCIGDKQHLNGMKGFNSYLVSEAAKKGVLEEKKTVKLDAGRLKKSMVEGLDPFIRDMSGREEGVSEFLKNLNLDPDMNVEDLDDSQKRILSSAIIIKLLAQGTRSERAEDFITTKYWLPSWNLYATDLSNYVNSAGRMGEMGTGLALCLGDETALKISKGLRKEYKDELRQGMLKLESKGTDKLDNLQFFYIENPSLAGAHAGLGMMYLFDQEKPTIALSILENETRVSSRGTKYLVDKGLDLSVALREAAAEVGGSGGGHPVASGATIPKGKEDAFLEVVDYIVGKQLGDSGEKQEDSQ
jgi:RecJ-like exonuclease